MKSVKVKPEDHKWLLIEGVNQSKPVHEIVTELIECFKEAKKHGFPWKKA